MSERILAGNQPTPRACHDCCLWSAWEGACFREDDDDLPANCPHIDDDEDDE